jgi:hypothetical protein
MSSLAAHAIRKILRLKRKTKRAKDLAYCLLGLFGIAMPMKYGEGGKGAFLSR